MAVSYREWLNRYKALSCFLALQLLSCFESASQITWRKTFLIKERFQLAKNLPSARCSPFVISKVLAARIRKLITARARKNKRSVRMLANARKDHSIPLKRKMGKCPSYSICLISGNKKREENTPSPYLPCYSAATLEDSGCFLLRHNSVGSPMEKSNSVSSDRNILDKLCLSQAFTKSRCSVENSARKL